MGVAMTAAAGPHFINLDLEFDSAVDPAPLARHFGERVCVLYCGAAGSGFRLVLEAEIDYAARGDVQRLTVHFLRLLETLPPALRALWDQGRSRVFDYGFEGGAAGTAVCMRQLDVDCLRRIATLGAGLHITVYPPSPPAPPANQREG